MTEETYRGFVITEATEDWLTKQGMHWRGKYPHHGSLVGPTKAELKNSIDKWYERIKSRVSPEIRAIFDLEKPCGSTETTTSGN